MRHLGNVYLFYVEKWKKLNACACLKLIFAFFVIIFVTYLLSIFSYLLNEFVLQSNIYNTECDRCRGAATESSQIASFPRHIHQVYYPQDGSSELPVRLQKTQRSCRVQNPDYAYTLWDEQRVLKLINEDYPELLNLYLSYEKWIWRVDMARYLFIYHYGGFYLDMDMECIQGLEAIREGAEQNRSSVVVRMTDPVGFSNDFFAATPRHPFMWSVVTALPHAKRWFVFPYATNMFSIGTMFFWGRYLNYPRKSEFYILPHYRDYIVHYHDSSWHHWDGKVVWYFFNHAFLFWTLLAIIFICIVVIYRYFLKVESTINVVKSLSHV
ncbi:uncharacterized protein LOC127853019 isoform X1 [Dreissena polymorpha]|uniref:uncharacterized protein LOC127853019 isoform X1 n=1 Tax=Dreissena polymorpha TaxID=45954 RepID=UPI0022651411|nr:uncharacterized protein LOC127853019 isoform X1 [Dreissena polymorpha]